MLKFFLVLTLFLIYPASSQEGATISTEQAVQKNIESKHPIYFEEDLTQNNEGGSRFYREFVKMIFYLILIIAILFLILLFLKKILSSREQHRNGQSKIKILEQRALSSKSFLYLLKVDEHSLLIAESPAGVHTLTEFKSPCRAFEEVLDKKKESS